MPTYLIVYSFDGQGCAIVSAPSKKQAEELFFEGEWELLGDEDGSNYEILTTKKI